MNSSILVINCGSSSLKFALIDSASHEAVMTGLAEKLGLADACITFKHNGDKQTALLSAPDHAAAMHAIIEKLQQVSLLDSVKAIGHRVVHGGEHFKQSALLDETAINEIERCIKLAPLHNPAHILGIRTAIKEFPSLPQVAVFDTSFHQTMPEKAYLYAVPMKLYRENSLRRYGMHGTSYRFVAEEAAKMLGKPADETSLVIAHLGNGASISAIRNGKCADTSMGLTPLEGLVMGTRSGDIDPSVFGYLATERGMDIQSITNMLNKESGLLGLSELSNDCRELEEAAAKGHAGAKRALEVFAYRLAKYVASMSVGAGRLDAVVFTGGIGENSSFLRAEVINQLGFLGLKLDAAANEACIRGNAGRITAADSVPALVINTNEELMIAMDTAKLAGLAN
ncbi:acetate kinase [Chromobacterium violaceum]|uniref:acetate kinase n=1 Tax=Chromobacterium violaceum TaxID=536 RepID=UPI000C128757|nr:acetate kinase [Chromobacterium violaceum]ATP30650.1 acetate kinase [Chromobacterium violaceum]ATP34558.1 acetate kinase [Chromobacterium violaceum]